MINLRNSPFLWFAMLLLLAFGSVGIVNPPGNGLILLGLALICAISAGFGFIKYQPGRQIGSTLALGILIYSAGVLRIIQFETNTMPGQPLPQSTIMFGIVEVTEVLKEKDNSLSLRCKSLKLNPESNLDATTFTDKFLVLQIRENTLTDILPGDRIVVRGWVSTFQGPMNPHAFDIRTYYKSIGIRHQMTCKGTEVFLHTASTNSLLRLTAKWQSTLCSIVRKNTSTQVAQLTNALVWGDRKYMDEEIRDAFADSGAMHVLSVSGMHMAIVYSMLYLILGAPGSGVITRRIVRFALYTIAIVLYMGLTGACPAVVRSGLMIILFLLGKAMGWNTQIWNLLGFAAFLMLWINPFVMLNIGFQLSFLAMAGILLYAKPMIRFFAFKNIVLHRIWEVTAVSIAAQVFIFPLLLLHFFQFPLTFVASSLVAMPASYVVIFGALLNTCLSFLHWSWLWKMFDIACQYFILSMKWMAGLNPDMNYSLPAVAGILLTSMAILFSVALIYRWPKGKKLGYLLGIIAFIHLGWHRAIQWNKNELVFYHQYKGLLTDIILDGHCVSICDSLVTPRSADFAARGHRSFKDVISTHSLAKSDGCITSSLKYVPPFLEIQAYRIMFWDGNAIQEESIKSITHLLIDQTKNFPALKNMICEKPGLFVILPAHLNRYSKNALVTFLLDNNIRYHDIGEQGAITFPL
ncbi:MAG TPA: ComEC/Rec2 family competence protein [Saprospiraceae bacterium]